VTLRIHLPRKPQLDAAAFYNRLESGRICRPRPSRLPVNFAALPDAARSPPDILSIHNILRAPAELYQSAARAAAAEVPEARVTFFATKTLSVGSG